MQNNNEKLILITGGAGFIGSNFVNTICKRESAYRFIILDALTYAGDYKNIGKVIDSCEHISFVKGDIRDTVFLEKLFNENDFNGVLNFAAESHVDNSIENPNIFVETNVLGTLNLLNVSRKKDNLRFLQVSTDEVYGSLNEGDPSFTEDSQISPNSPYSASKASADHLVRSYFETYGMDVVTTRCSNNYGPRQLKEKLIPLMINNALKNISLPVYGDGKNIRDWIYVDDHNEGVWLAFLKGESGHVYNFGGDCEKRNIDIVKYILNSLGKEESLISFVEDRLGHDWRYSIDFSKSKNILNWEPRVSFLDGMKKTIDWYRDGEGK